MRRDCTLDPRLEREEYTDFAVTKRKNNGRTNIKEKTPTCDGGQESWFLLCFEVFGREVESTFVRLLLGGA